MRLVWTAVATFVGMLCAAGLAAIVYPDDWRPVEATVLATDIRSTRPGTPQWSLEADIAYEVEGRRFEREGLEVFRDPDYDVTDAERRDWPAGRTLTVHYRASDPGEVSIWEDGGRQAAIVVSALLVPVVAALAFLLVSVARARARARTR